MPHFAKLPATPVDIHKQVKTKSLVAKDLKQLGIEKEHLENAVTLGEKLKDVRSFHPPLKKSDPRGGNDSDDA